VWEGGKDADGYGVKSVTINKIEYLVKVHRLVYFLNYSQILKEEEQISHLCGNKSCCHLPHLSLETATENNSRQACFRDSNCFDHTGYPECNINAHDLVIHLKYFSMA
jgi:hypothetical protein